MTQHAMDTAQRHSAAMLGKLLPELSACAALLLIAIDPSGRLGPDPAVLFALLVVEGASLMLFCTLVDIATRVSRRPPWWLALLILAGVLLMYPETIEVLKLAFDLGMWVFVPVVWSLLERVRELWTLPAASKEEKIRRRTLTFDRLWVAVLIGGIAALCAIMVALISDQGLGAIAHPLAGVAIGLPFYAVAAFNAWRVHQPRFAQRPTSLVPWLDRGEGTYLSPL